MDDVTREKVIEAYNTSRNSIQDIARIHRVSVNEVLIAVGEKQATEVSTPGDLIGSDEAGPNVPMNHGKTFPSDYSTD